jgi:hypothetical protein
VLCTRHLESVQRRFTKRLRGLADITYADRLAALDLDRLDLRRLRLDLTFTYKIFFGHVDLISDRFCTLRTTSNTRRHPFKIVVKRSRLDVRRHFFSHRIVRVWNALPAFLQPYKFHQIYK